ncbi:MAG TPA: YebC/PmpR family DNA-binding transcriptional regulator [Clostridiales bacterium]|nr:YebC/PmpR family DNA-binding transcriptional regulator [Clostridiales bacterium]
MAGHSKWANIKRRKAAVDAKKGALFTKLGRELISAAREGGGNPDANFRLRLAIEKARAANMPMENIQRAILKGTGELDEGATYEEFVYEGYGPGGAAVMVELMTDNRNRTAQEIRHLFTRHGGNLGEAGCVAWMFKKKGSIIVAKEDNSISEDDLMLLALEAGAEDIKDEGDAYEILTAPSDLEPVVEALKSAGVTVAQAEPAMVPQSTVPLTGETAEKCLALIEALEDHEDVQNVYSNADFQT